MYQRAGCLHDALYASHLFDRGMDVTLEAMESDGVGYSNAMLCIGL